MHQDIFDRLMALRIFAPVRPVYKKHKEGLLYLFFGGLTFFLNIGVYALLADVLHWDPLFSNVIAWIAGVLFAYVTNHVWVFEGNAHTPAAIARELAAFSAGRLATLGMEEAMLWAGITLLHMNDLLVKLIAQVAVIIGNYLISKLLVFRKD